jgi:excisionase family DNA binding protein
LLEDVGSTRAGVQDSTVDISENQQLGSERETGFEPATLHLGKGIGPFVGQCRQSQTVETPGDSPRAGFHSVAFSASLCSPFAAPVLQALLPVRAVATQLGVSAATVYKLCARRQLPYVRVLGAIRIAPADVAAYIARLGT